METAGTVQIQITGNIGPFEAALARAQQQAAQFDAQITAKLSGSGMSAGLEKIAALVEQNNALLAKLTTSGTAASAALTKVATSTKATTEALTMVSAATKAVNAEMAAIGASGGGAAALTAGTISAKEFALALEQTGGNLSRITPQMLGLAEAETVVAATSKSAAAGMEALAVAETEAAGLGAGVTREFSVLGAEIARGNFSRIPGSLIVMNERLAATGTGVLTLTNMTKAFGALGSVIFNPYVLGFLAISTGIEVASRAFGALKGDVSAATAALEEHKKTIDAITAAYPEAAAAAKKYEEIAKALPNSVATADLSKDIVTNATALDATLKQIQDKFAAPFAAGGRSDFGGFGRAAAVEFADLSKELASGSLDAIQLQNELGKIRLDPTLSIKAHEYAGAMQDLVNKAVDLENAMKEGAGLKSIGPDGQKAQQSLFDVSAGFKDVQAKAGNADATIAKLFGTMNSGGGSGFGVTRSLAGQVQATAGMFKTIDQAVQESRQHQLQGMVDLEAQFRATTTEVDVLKNAIATAGSKENIQQFFGDVSNIKDANAEIANATSTVTKLFDAMNHGNASVSAVNDGLQMVRQTLINDGFAIAKVDAFIQRLMQTRMQLDSDTVGARQLNQAIQAIRDKTVNIVVRTTQIGTGTQTSYSVPSSYSGAEGAGTGSSYGLSGSSNVNVNRYGGDGTAGFSQQLYTVPSESGGGTSGVTVTRFGGTRAGGGPVAAGMPYWVGEQGPELVVPSSAGSVVPNASSVMFSQALASAQSAFTGRLPTQDSDRMWTVQMNIEANTKKTFQILDEIKTATASASSAFGGSSYGGSSSSTVDKSAYDAAFNAAFKTAQANYQAARIAGGGDGIVPFAQGLVATPFQIALNAARLATGQGGTKAVGFDSGGMIAPGDSQEVKFFKSPEETVAIFTPSQVAALKGAGSTQTTQAADQRPISISMPVTIHAGAQVSNDSIAEMRRQMALAAREAVRAINGR
ncbi:hypothetical protein [Mesorhizobium sp. RIZ17]|uniref:hypothetical protein n=1 Tax=Mesorhizobium sp. RIZ17 TaxID=3132743 RepID=UPI003DA7FA71